MSDPPDTDSKRPARPGGTHEGDTAEEPSPSEIGEPGTPGAGLTPAEPHAADAEIAHHDAATHTEAHAEISDDDHGHAEAALGPIDWQSWTYALVAAVPGLMVVVAFWIAVA